MRIKLSEGSATFLQKITIYEEARVKLTKSQISKLSFGANIRPEKHYE